MHTQSPPVFIGLVNLSAVSGPHLSLPRTLAPPATSPSTLVVELAYAFLPASWGRGYAAEAVGAVLAAGRRSAVWDPWRSVWMRVIVNQRNPRSERVMQKCGVQRRGVFVWRGERIFIGGEWRGEDELLIFGEWLVGGEGGEGEVEGGEGDDVKGVEGV